MLSIAVLALLAPLVAGHGFIKQVTVNGQTTQAQKTNIKQSSFRAVADNTGWIGSNFFSSDCTVCGCSSTPFGTVAAPGGTNFADASQSAGQTPSTAAGSTVTLHVAGNPGQGWPHPVGHLQAYMARCPASGCTNFDARDAEFFKVQGLKNGVPAMRATFNAAADSNSWPIEIPQAVQSGSYILKAEIWAYGQSSSAEGNQVQYYPFCMNLAVTGGGNANPATVKFPDVIANDKNIVSQGQNYLPGPEINELFGGTGTGSGSASPAPASSPSPAPASSPSPASAPSPPSTGSNKGTSSNSGGLKKSSKSGRKCKAVTSTKRKRRSTHRRHHHRGQRHASS